MNFLKIFFRIGRTGRTGQTGRFRSVSYFNAKKDEFFAPTLMKYLVDSNSQIPQFFQKIADDARVKEDERQRFLRNNTDKVMAKYMNKLSVDSKGPPACDNDNNNK
jgi:superfamily II DNA/RNA helicase